MFRTLNKVGGRPGLSSDSGRAVFCAVSLTLGAEGRTTLRKGKRRRGGDRHQDRDTATYDDRSKELRRPRVAAVNNEVT
ncbi:hypothetical protein GCM10011401_27690 [Nesterenkonia cremea]|uniref:Uncharacterized protein n=1 Tax=Nesterenkonia cremea TaxID=1882340 RepID=A0A917AV89_9MICC|nr:hypothetical protein GCM10011401_27690 [Nesterenkonia cremea]